MTTLYTMMPMIITFRCSNDKGNTSHIAAHRPFVSIPNHTILNTLLVRGRFHFIDGIRQVKNLGVELVHKRFKLRNIIEHFDATGVRIESHLERPRHGRHPTPELVFHVVKALRHIIDGLVLLVLVRLHRGGCRLERPQLWLVAERVQELAVCAE